MSDRAQETIPALTPFEQIRQEINRYFERLGIQNYVDLLNEYILSRLPLGDHIILSSAVQVASPNIRDIAEHLLCEVINELVKSGKIVYLDRHKQRQITREVKRVIFTLKSDTNAGSGVKEGLRIIRTTTGATFTIADTRDPRIRLRDIKLTRSELNELFPQLNINAQNEEVSLPDIHEILMEIAYETDLPTIVDLSDFFEAATLMLLKSLRENPNNIEQNTRSLLLKQKIFLTEKVCNEIKTRSMTINDILLLLENNDTDKTIETILAEQGIIGVRPSASIYYHLVPIFTCIFYTPTSSNSNINVVLLENFGNFMTLERRKVTEELNKITGQQRDEFHSEIPYIDRTKGPNWWGSEIYMPDILGPNSNKGQLFNKVKDMVIAQISDREVSLYELYVKIYEALRNLNFANLES